MSKKKKTPVIISMATIEERKESMIDTLISLRGQFDELHIYANDYLLLPGDLPSDIGNVTIYSGLDEGMQDLGDAAFMYPFTDDRAPEDNSLCFIVGDDVLYPANYVVLMKGELDRIGKGSVISLHGRRQFSPLESYYGSLTAKQAFNGFRAVANDQEVTVLGTAFVCWYSDLIDWSMEDFPQEWKGMNSRNMGDIWFSKKLNEKGIKRTVAKHRSHWVKHSKKINMNTTLSVKGKQSDPVQTALFNSVEWVV